MPPSDGPAFLCLQSFNRSHTSRPCWQPQACCGPVTCHKPHTQSSVASATASFCSSVLIQKPRIHLQHPQFASLFSFFKTPDLSFLQRMHLACASLHFSSPSKLRFCAPLFPRDASGSVLPLLRSVLFLPSLMASECSLLALPLLDSERNGSRHNLSARLYRNGCRPSMHPQAFHRMPNADHVVSRDYIRMATRCRHSTLSLSSVDSMLCCPV